MSKGHSRQPEKDKNCLERKGSAPFPRVIIFSPLDLRINAGEWMVMVCEPSSSTPGRGDAVSAQHWGGSGKSWGLQRSPSCSSGITHAQLCPTGLLISGGIQHLSLLPFLGRGGAGARTLQRTCLFEGLSVLMRFYNKSLMGLCLWRGGGARGIN